MPVENVVELDLTRPMALRIIKGLAESSENIFVGKHAEKRMRERKITRTQVMRCLQKGHITEGPARSIKGNWEFKMEVFSAGEPVAVVAALDHDENGNYIVVITVYNS